VSTAFFARTFTYFPQANRNITSKSGSKKTFCELIDIITANYELMVKLSVCMPWRHPG